MQIDNLTPEERKRRRKLVRSACNMMRKSYLVQAEDEMSMMICRNKYCLQVMFSESHPLMVLCLIKEFPILTYGELMEALNDLNNHSVLGTHGLNVENRCYTFRATQWLDSDLTSDRLSEMLYRCELEADRGYEKLKHVHRGGWT